MSGKIWWNTWSNFPFTIAGGQSFWCWFNYGSGDYEGPVSVMAWPLGDVTGTVITLESGVECTFAPPPEDDHQVAQYRYWVHFHNPGTSAVTFWIAAG